MLCIDTRNTHEKHEKHEKHERHERHEGRDPIEAAFLKGIADGDRTIRPVYADWLEERGQDLHAEYVRAQQELLSATDISTFDERARQLALLAIALDPRWCEQLECPQVAERLAGRRLGWLTYAFVEMPELPKPGTWELPKELRYLEALTPKRPPEPLVMAPRRNRRWWE